MNALSIKLREIAKTYGVTGGKFIKDIKQAFIEAGYITREQHIVLMRHELKTLGGTRLTGAEWYERYNHELEKVSPRDLLMGVRGVEKLGIDRDEAAIMFVATVMADAAKKASRIKEQLK